MRQEAVRDLRAAIVGEECFGCLKSLRQMALEYGVHYSPFVGHGLGKDRHLHE